MKRFLLLLLALVLTAAPLAAAGKILLVAHDLEDHPLPGLRFTYAGFDSRPTNPAGTTELDLPAGYETGRQIKILLLASKKAEDWFLVNPQGNIPNPSDPADVVLMRRRTFRQVAAETETNSAAGTQPPRRRPGTSSALRDATAARSLSPGDDVSPVRRNVKSHARTERTG